MNDRDPDQDILDEYERRIVEGTDLEGLTRAPIKTSPNARANFSIRLNKEEFGVISAAAKSRGVTVTDFIREGAMTAAEQELAAKDAATMDLAEMAQELDRLHQRIEKRLRLSARANAGVKS